jgi:MFS family permease
VIFFEQDHLIDMRGYDRLAFAAAYPMTSITTVFFGLVCGDLIDRLGSLRLLPYFLLPLAIAAAVIGLTTPMWGVYLFMFLLGISNGFTSTLLEPCGRRSLDLPISAASGRSSYRLWCSRRRSGPVFLVLSSTEESRCRSRCSGCPGGASRRASCWPSRRHEYACASAAGQPGKLHRPERAR